MTPVYADDLAGNLPKGWDICPFEELVYFQEGPGIRNWQYVEEGVPFVNIRCLVDGRLDRMAMSHVSKEEALGKYQHFLLEADDYVVSSSGTLGRIATVQPSDLPCMLNTSVIRMRPKTKRLDRGYLKYFLLSDYYQAQILSFATGSAQLNYGPMHLRQMFIVSPPLPEQRAIAHILGTLDDKIELNRRMNETLEATARTLFKSWFVDFDPVRAKAEGRDPGLSKPFADHFPDSFEDSELGEIPKGWKVGKIGDCCEQIQNGGTPRRNEPRYWDGGNIPWLGSGEVRQPVITGTESFITEAGLNESSAKWVPSHSTVVALYGATAGQVSILSFPLTTNQAVCALIPKKNFALLNYLTMREATTALERKAVGSAQQNISKGIVEETQMIVPPSSVLERFAVMADSLLGSWVANLYQSRTLAAMRDTLLPQLISGALRIDATEQFIKESSI